MNRTEEIKKELEEIKKAFNHKLLSVNEYSDMIYQRNQELKKLERKND